MVADRTGSLAGIKRHDYLPFGEELYANTGGRTITQGYNAVGNVRQKFTSKERDSESLLDYFGARYYSSAQAKFTSVDPENASASSDDPQSWNGYVYARNNPLLYTDPDGRLFLLRRANGNTEIITDAQFDQMKNNPNNAELGVAVTGGHIYNRNENGEMVSVGTYERVWFDDQSDFSNGVFFKLSRYGPAMEKTIFAFAVANLAPAVLITGSGALGGELTSLGLETTAEQAGTTAIRQSVLQAFERQLAQHGRRSLEKSLNSLEKRLAEHLANLEEYRRAGGYTSSVETEINTFREQIRAIKEILGRTP
jgi:RHS repeat-associated protein